MHEGTGPAALARLLRRHAGAQGRAQSSAPALARLASLARRHWLAVICVVIPGLLAGVYFAFVASDVYISESRFVVREPDKPAATGLGLILKGIGFSNSGDELMATREYILSRDALAALDRKGGFERAYRRPGVAWTDRFDPLGLSGTFEDLYDYYAGTVSVERDSTSGVAVLRVRAFTGADAARFNRRLLAMAERRVNAMNARGRSDLVRQGIAEVEVAKRRSLAAAQALGAYRDQRRVADPQQQGMVTLQLVSKLQDELVRSRTMLAQVRGLAPDNPQIPVLEQRVAMIAREIDREIASVAGSPASLAATSVEYQRLVLESEFADKQLAAAMTSLEQSRSEAARQQAYVETIAQPNLPDSPLEPRRLRGIVTVIVLGLVAWGIVHMVLAGLMEHRE
ncbi:hypothetical protein [Novosphingobium aureum]|uniref:hypothetical protein n=1 Tax=Novosphingobium aureum TaxID=2792964 RepID=UPI001E3A3C65|nr:hypothetical protein [Novosphingobium aureum]